MANIRIKDISQLSERKLAVVWTDGKKSTFDVVDLRRRCPCAHCVDEWTGQKKLTPDQVPDSVRPLRIESVGSYAMRVAFNDGHSTGIYTFQMLREFG